MIWTDRIVLISTIILLNSILLISIDHEEDIFAREAPSRYQEDTFDNYLDIQFMVDPSDDPRDPLNGSKWSKISPGSVADHEVVISNIGPINGTIHIELDEPPRDSGYDWFIKETGNRTLDVKLTSTHIRDIHGGRSLETFEIRVNSPDDIWLGTSTCVGINATMREPGNIDENLIRDRDELILVTAESPDWLLSHTQPQRYIARPGEWLTAPITLTHNGNRDMIEVQITVRENDYRETAIHESEDAHYEPSLEFNWTKKIVGVKQGTTYEDELEFRIPPDSEEDIFRFRYTARIQKTEVWGISDSITVVADDGDGYLWETDDFPDDPSAWIDSDGDKRPDRIVGNSTTGLTEDKDDDNDGTEDKFDDFPLDPSAVNDTDGDGMPDRLQGNSNTGLTEDTDDDNDGYPDIEDEYPLNPHARRDTDGDGYPDELIQGTRDLFEDPDDDNDGYLDDWELILGTDPKNGSSRPVDTDGEGMPDGDPFNSRIWMDIDDDGDLTVDILDAFPKDPSASNDTDGDGKPDSIHGNSTTGLVEDEDDDNDGFVDTEDYYPLDDERHLSPGEGDDKSPWIWILLAALLLSITAIISFMTGRNSLANGRNYE